MTVSVHAQKQSLVTFRCKLTHHCSIPQPRVRNFGEVFYWFLHFICWKSTIFLLPVWPTDLQSILTTSTPRVIISTKFEVDVTIHCQVIALLLLIHYVTLTFDILTPNSCHTWRVTWPTLPPTLKTLRLFVLELIYNVSFWLPLIMLMRPLRMRQITWPVSRWSKAVTLLEPWTSICLFTVLLSLGYDD